MKDLMIENSELSNALIFDVENGNKLDEDGDKEKALNIYHDAWQKLPEPKNQWKLFSQWIANCLFHSYMDSGNYTEAKKWAEISYESRPSDIESSCFVQLGAANLELGKGDIAIEWFKRAYEIGKYRAFQGFDKKYFDFYKLNK